MMIKTCSATDWKGLVDRPQATAHIKVASSGLGPNDAHAFAKIAGDELAHQMRKLNYDPNSEYVYDVALGCHEVYGANRNGDGYSRALLNRRIKSFEKNAKCYRNHKADNPDFNYGDIAYATVHPQMGYGHLVMRLNATKSACDKYGGYLADKELNALEKYGSYATSQGIRVTHDVCQACDNISKTRADYCRSRSEGGDCPLFGCASGLSKVASDGSVQWVDNPDGLFYDNSLVDVGADRIAFASRVTELIDKVAMLKTAGDGLSYDATELYGVGGGAWLAEQLGATCPPLPISASDVSFARRKYASMVSALSAAEQSVRQELAAVQDGDRDLQAGLAVKNAVLASQLWQTGAPLQLVQKTAREGVICDPASFLEAAGLTKGAAERVALCAGNAVERLSQSLEAAHILNRSRFLQAGGRELGKIAATHETLRRGDVAERALLKIAVDNDAAEKVLSTLSQPRPSSSQLTSRELDALHQYATYKLAALTEIWSDQPETATLALRQAWVAV